MARRLSLLSTALLAAATLAAGAAAAPHRTVDVTAISSVPVRCYPSLDAYFADSGIAPVRYWLGIAGFYGVPHSDWSSTGAAPLIGLTENTCNSISRLPEGVTVARAYAVFTLAHELAHALGTADETEADCRGAGLLPEVAAELGLHGAKAFAELERQARRSAGYAPIPASCWVSS